MAEEKQQRRRPVIGVTCDNFDGFDRYRSNMEYAQAVERAGGLPILLPYKVDVVLVKQYVDLCDGFCFTGGNDLDPSLYCNEPWHEKAEQIDPARQRFELALIKEVEMRRRPALGVCLGSQLMNVHRGGSLCQFLPDVAQGNNPLDHRRPPAGELRRHPVQVEPGTSLGAALGTASLSVNTYHKQGIRKLGEGLRVVATAPDGLIEAFEDPSYPLFAAIQWHPERLIDEPSHLAPFKLLVEKSSRAS